MDLRADVTYHPPPPAHAGGGGSSYYPNIVFAAVLGYRPLLLDLRVPPGPGPWPVVVRIHGGAWWEGSRLWQLATEREDFTDLLPRRGYALADVDYRLSREATFPAQLHDVKAAIRWLRAFSGQLRLDPDRFAAWGDSAGGHLAALAGLTSERDLEGTIGVTDASSAVQAVVDWFGVATLFEDHGDGDPAPYDLDPYDPASWLLGGPTAERREEALRASPVRYVHPAAPPFLCVHGAADKVVPPAHSELLAAALRQQKVHCELELVEGAGHGFTGAEADRLIDRSIDFLDRMLHR